MLSDVWMSHLSFLTSSLRRTVRVPVPHSFGLLSLRAYAEDLEGFFYHDSDTKRPGEDRYSVGDKLQSTFLGFTKSEILKGKKINTRKQLILKSYKEFDFHGFARAELIATADIIDKRKNLQCSQYSKTAVRYPPVGQQNTVGLQRSECRSSGASGRGPPMRNNLIGLRNLGNTCYLNSII